MAFRRPVQNNHDVCRATIPLPCLPRLILKCGCRRQKTDEVSGPAPHCRLLLYHTIQARHMPSPAKIRSIFSMEVYCMVHCPMLGSSCLPCSLVRPYTCFHISHFCPHSLGERSNCRRRIRIASNGARLIRYAVAVELKKHRCLDGVSIIAVTSYAMVGDRKQVVAAGSIGQPTNPDTFVNESRRHLAGNLETIDG
jgi:hypothetical protein